MDGRTPGYMVRKKLQRKKIREKAAKKAWEFEKRIEQGRGGELARKCWKKVRKRGKKGKKMGRGKKKVF